MRQPSTFSFINFLEKHEEERVETTMVGVYLAPPLELLKWCSMMLGTTRDGLTKFGMLDSYSNINLVYATLDHFQFLRFGSGRKDKSYGIQQFGGHFAIKL